MRDKRNVCQDPEGGLDRQKETETKREMGEGGRNYLKGTVTFRQRMNPVYVQWQGLETGVIFPLSFCLTVLTQAEAREQKTLSMQSIQLSFSGHRAW